uniref:Ion transport domain-containing protein n=1 Tax=Pinguiococcus pyrenoidosus TaxID=172671 RepID=A0A6U0W853_9STRA
MFHAFYFTIVTMTTVGFGDQVPQLLLTRFLAVLCMIFGVLYLAMPITIVGHEFEKAWDIVVRKEENEKQLKLVDDAHNRRLHNTTQTVQKMSVERRRENAIFTRTYRVMPMRSSKEWLALTHQLLLQDFVTVTRFLWRAQAAIRYIKNDAQPDKNDSLFTPHDEHQLWFLSRDAEDAHKRLVLTAVELLKGEEPFKKISLAVLALCLLDKSSGYSFKRLRKSSLAPFETLWTRQSMRHTSRESSAGKASGWGSSSAKMRQLSRRKSSVWPDGQDSIYSDGCESPNEEPRATADKRTQHEVISGMRKKASSRTVPMAWDRRSEDTGNTAAGKIENLAERFSSNAKRMSSATGSDDETGIVEYNSGEMPPMRQQRRSVRLSEGVAVSNPRTSLSPSRRGSQNDGRLRKSALEARKSLNQRRVVGLMDSFRRPSTDRGRLSTERRRTSAEYHRKSMAEEKSMSISFTQHQPQAQEIEQFRKDANTQKYRHSDPSQSSSFPRGGAEALQRTSDSSKDENPSATQDGKLDGNVPTGKAIMYLSQLARSMSSFGSSREEKEATEPSAKSFTDYIGQVGVQTVKDVFTSSKKVKEQRRQQANTGRRLGGKVAKGSTAPRSRFGKWIRAITGEKIYGALSNAHRQKEQERRLQVLKGELEKAEYQDVDDYKQRLESKTWRDQLWLLLEVPYSSVYAEIYHVLLIIFILASLAAFALETVPDYRVYSERGRECEKVVQVYCDNKRDPMLDPGCFVFNSTRNISPDDLSKLYDTPFGGWQPQYIPPPDPRRARLHFDCDAPNCFGVGENFGSEGRLLTCDEMAHATLRPFQTQATLPEFSSLRYTGDEIHQLHDVCLRPECFNAHYTLVDAGRIWTPMEIVFSSFFSLEVLLRILVARSVGSFLRDRGNILDIVSLIPFYTEVLSALVAGRDVRLSYSSTDSSYAGVLQVLKTFRIFKVLRHHRGAQILYQAVKDSIRQLRIPLAFLFLISLIASMFLYHVEVGTECFKGEVDYCREEYESYGYTWQGFPEEARGQANGTRVLIDKVGDSSLMEDFLDVFWFAIVTMTSVGYGDIVPRTKTGQVTTILLMIFGTFYLAMPISIMGKNFFRAYHASVYADKKLEEITQNFLKGAADDGRRNVLQLNERLRDALAKYRSSGRRFQSIRRGLFGGVNADAWTEEEVRRAVRQAPLKGAEEESAKAKAQRRKRSALILLRGAARGGERFDWSTEGFEMRFLRRYATDERIERLEYHVGALMKANEAFERVVSSMIEFVQAEEESSQPEDDDAKTNYQEWQNMRERHEVH